VPLAVIDSNNFGTIFANVYQIINTMTKNLLKLLTISFLLLSCERESLYVDPVYPSTYFEIPTGLLSSMRTSLSSNYPYLKTSVNQFGFCYWPDDYIDTNPPPIPNLLTEAAATQLARNFISGQPAETGIKNLGDLVIARTYPLTGGIHWTVVTSNQKVNNIEVVYTEVVIRITNGALVSCVGNWFPDIYIPDKFNFNESGAKSNLIGKDVTHYNIGGGKYYVTIAKPDINNTSGELKIVPITTDNKIELRVTWMFNIPSPVYCMVYVDVMTGEIILQVPTIIS
jgi:hypothetical protein